MYSFCGSFHLAPPHRIHGRDDLSVQVGESYFIIIDQVQRPDTAAGQCLYDVTSDAADAEDGHSRAP